ncbi:Ubiquitin carboxyl-terminal hydrolase 19 [Amphibalanus amphitrite]|uniref:ubiquitinyl hydrolase 1 n=1 Tax=Amphibalanus amphitrite TaxID=1232801 RepID=A0A6A4W0Q6_AMPAM|nr:Ubiquitin carboxyl-terminal hydrolase 19 [Amphibalanus amphitrite]
MPDATKSKKKKKSGGSAKSDGSSPGRQGTAPATPVKKALPAVTHEWRDAGSEVRVTLVTGPLAGAGRVQLDCSERRVQLRLPDGRTWSSRLFAAVLPDGSEHQQRPGGRILVKLLKHDPSLAWPSLEPMKIPRVKSSPPTKETPPTKEMKEKTNTEEIEETAGRISERPGSPAPNGAPPGPSDAPPGPNDAPPGPDDAPPGPDGEPGASPPPPAAVEPVLLDNLKHDTFETDADIRVSVYLRHIKKETLAISYDSDSFSMVFGTRKHLVKALLQVHQMLLESEPRYILNQLYIDDMCMWLQQVDEPVISGLSDALQALTVTKEDVSLDLVELEAAAGLVLAETQSQQKDLADTMGGLALDSDDSEDSESSSDSDDDSSSSDSEETDSEEDTDTDSEDDTVACSWLHCPCLISIRSLPFDSDRRFLAARGQLDECFLFRWTVPLKGRVLPDLCCHKVTNSAVELRLVKAIPGRWNALRPPAPPPASVPAAAAASRRSPSRLSESAALPDPAGGGDRPDPPTKLVRPPSPLPIALPPPPPPPVLAPLERGFTGLDNIGNTCFLNSVIQCLANTRELRDYFADSLFQADINQHNPLGMKGQLALAFAVLMRVLWSGEHRSYNPHKLKALVAKRFTQFTGFAQHDAQEFMAFLLDGLHEDLNRVVEKPYTQTEEAGDRPDDEVAREAWYRYRLRDDSVIVDLFQGQYKSKLVCPDCGKVSVTFDPFLYLSVPLPKKKRPVCVTFFRADHTVRPITYTLYVSADGLADEIMEKLAEKTGVASRLIKLIDERKHKVQKVYTRGMSAGTIGRGSHLLAFEQLDPVRIGEPVLELLVIQRLQYPSAARVCSSCKKEPTADEKLRRCTRCYRTSYCDSHCQKDHWPHHRELCRPWPPEPVGCPFLVSLPRSRASYTEVCRAMEAFSRYSVNVFCVPVTADRERRDSVSSGTSSDSGKCTDTEETATEKEVSSSDSTDCREAPSSSGMTGDQQLFVIRSVDQQGENVVSPDSGRIQDNGDEPLDLRGPCTVAMDWKTARRRWQPCCLVDDKELESDPDPHPEPEPTGRIGLHQCLRLFTEPERLSPGEAWYCPRYVLSVGEAWHCPRCKAHREAEKQLSLWRLPLNLIIQLKRFSFKESFYGRDKIDRMVEFPVRDLNLRQYLTEEPDEGRVLYDLYGVINHHGGILGGHYTAFARCVDPLRPENAELGWRRFDDARVVRMKEEEVMTSEAYLLFYRRRIPYAAPERATDAEEID